ncbi:hypothetical protein [Amycolatopsis sp. MEPSY49]|uniref:hypothetical protein n=1 Tax=Amycolatopsis sp. MEPSY49 TaxID=3151600 RepID=UPI003EF12725
MIETDLVLQLGNDELIDLTTSNPLGISGIEDIAPFEIALAAADGYCREFVPAIEVSALAITEDIVWPSTADTAC